MPAKSKTYRELNAELDDVLVKLQDPELDIDEAAQAYEKGLQLIAQLEKHLEQAENKIRAVRAGFEGGTSPASE